jgi:hypothetical protein
MRCSKKCAQAEVELCQNPSFFWDRQDVEKRNTESERENVPDQSPPGHASRHVVEPMCGLLCPKIVEFLYSTRSLPFFIPFGKLKSPALFLFPVVEPSLFLL